MGLAAAGLGVAAIVGVVPFLATVKPSHQGVLVVEGWLPDYALEEAKQTFESHSYRLVVVTGVPIEQGSFLGNFQDYAQLGAATLREFGMDEKRIVPVSCPDVPKDRTYSTACQVHRWLKEQSSQEAVDVFTLGVHARRTWLLYRLALGSSRHVGIIAGEDRRFERRWWTTSSGFRIVTGEAIAFIYAKFLFYPSS